MISPSAYRESIARLDVRIFEIESVITRMEKCVALKDNRNMRALIQSLRDKRDKLTQERDGLKYGPTPDVRHKKRSVTIREHLNGY